MLYRTLHALIALVFLCASAQGQNIATYDPSFVPLGLRQTPIDACGISIAADPTWARKAVRDTTSTGLPRRGVDFNTGSEYWDRRAESASKYVFHIRLDLSVTCFPTKLSETGKTDGLKNFSDRMYANAKKLPGVKPKRLKKTKVAGLGTVYVLKSSKQHKTEQLWNMIVDRSSFYALHEGQLIIVRASIRRKPPGNYVFDLRKGAVIEFKDESGAVAEVFRLGSNAQRHVLTGTIAASRSARDNANLLDTLLKSMRPL